MISILNTTPMASSLIEMWENDQQRDVYQLYSRLAAPIAQSLGLPNPYRRYLYKTTCILPVHDYISHIDARGVTHFTAKAIACRDKINIHFHHQGIYLTIGTRLTTTIYPTDKVHVIDTEWTGVKRYAQTYRCLHTLYT